MTSEHVSVAVRIRRHADGFAAGGRSPLSVALMRAAADDLERQGVVAELFDGVPAPPGSVPALRLLATLQRLVLTGRAPALVEYYRGTRAPDGAWPAAAAALRAHLDLARTWVREPVQTNEPGRAVVLYGGLLWASERFGRPLRLLEIGASGGLNLLADRFAYVVDGTTLGDPASPVRFEEPWIGAPVPDAPAAAAALRIVARRGCDPTPLDLGDEHDRLRLRAWVWAGETERTERVDAALEIASREPPRVDAEPAEAWLPSVLGTGRTPAVIWQSVVWQYLSDAARAGITDAIAGAGEGGLELAWIRMEPIGDAVRTFAVRATTWPGGEVHELGRPGNHGPPVHWAPA
jgi:hypothetical protein